MIATRLLPLLGVVCAGCISDVRVRNLAEKPDAAGVRAALPLPFIQVTPTPNGEIKVATKYLPDPDARFAIHGWSFLAKHTLDIEVADGILTSVTWNADTTAVASKSIDAVAGIEAERAKAAADAQKEARAAEQAREKEIRDAERAVSEAESELQIMINHYGAASDEAERAQIELERARAKLAALKAQFQTGDRAAIESEERAWGPMLFGIEEQYDEGGKLTSVRLVPAHEQGRWRRIK